MSKLKILIIGWLLFAGIFIVSGYGLSDDKYFKDLIAENNITTPEQAFQYVSDRIEFPGDLELTKTTMTPRYMLQKKYIWCDQGAMIVATIIHELGNETRLVDIGNPEEGFGHTYLQVLENGEWKNYDTVLKKSGITEEEIVEQFNHKAIKIYSQPRSYPNAYNWFIQNNFYLKHLALWLRSAPG